MALSIMGFSFCQASSERAFNFFKWPMPVAIYCVIYLSSGPPLNQTKPPLELCISFNFDKALSCSLLIFTISNNKAIFFFCWLSFWASITHGVSCNKADFNSSFFCRFDINAAVSVVFHFSKTVLIFGIDLLI